jgi:hypothetical protein
MISTMGREQSMATDSELRSAAQNPPAPASTAPLDEVDSGIHR